MPESSVAAKAQQRRILVVDDDDGMLKLLSSALTPRGFAVTSCLTGREALHVLQGNSFNVVLLDLGLPDINGMDLIQQFRVLAPSCRVVIITADNTSESLLRAIGQQAYEYIRKPFSIPDLLEVLNLTLEAEDAPAIEVLSAKPNWFELSIPCTHSAVDRIERFVRQLSPDLGGELTPQVIQALREIVLNAVEWGGGLDPKRRVRICCIRTTRFLLYRVADPGPGFRFEDIGLSSTANGHDPMQVAAVREQKGMRPGGLGIRLAQASVDELLYNDKQNEVVLVKYLDAPAPQP